MEDDALIYSIYMYVEVLALNKCWVSPTFSAIYDSRGDQSGNKPTSQTRKAVPIVEVYHYSITNPMFLLLTVSPL